MRKLPKHVEESAQRIADSTGVSVAEVVRRFSVAVKKSAFTRSDFFWGDSDISLQMKDFPQGRMTVKLARCG